MGVIEYADSTRSNEAGLSYERHMRRKGIARSTGGAGRDDAIYRQRLAKLRLVFPALPLTRQERLAKQARPR
jgi:hypothetical protein